MPAKTIQQPVVPVNYALHFDVKLDDDSYSGSEIITLKITQPTNTISLHAKGLKLLDASLNSDGKTYNIKESKLSKQIKIDEENEIIVLDFETKINPCNAILTLNFTGKLNNNLVGFYTSNYPGKDGSIKKMASTHLEPAHAREAFPCIDEPEAKATFDVSVTADKRFDVTSNTPEKGNDILSDGRKKSHR